MGDSGGEGYLDAGHLRLQRCELVHGARSLECVQFRCAATRMAFGMVRPVHVRVACTKHVSSCSPRHESNRAWAGFLCADEGGRATREGMIAWVHRRQHVSLTNERCGRERRSHHKPLRPPSPSRRRVIAHCSRARSHSTPQLRRSSAQPPLPPPPTPASPPLLPAGRGSACVRLQ